MVAETTKMQTWLNSTKWASHGVFQSTVSPQITASHFVIVWAGYAFHGVQTKIRVEQECDGGQPALSLGIKGYDS